MAKAHTLTTLWFLENRSKDSKLWYVIYGGTHMLKPIEETNVRMESASLSKILKEKLLL